MSCRIFLGLLELCFFLLFPDWLETESSIPCVDPSGCGGFGRMADQSPLTGCEPRNLVEIPSQQHADELSFQEKQFRCRLQRRAHLCRFWCHRHPGCGNAPPLLTQEREVNPFSASVPTAARSNEVRGSALDRNVERKERSRTWQCVVPRTRKILVWSMITLEDKLGELFKMNVELKEIFPCGCFWNRQPTWITKDGVASCNPMDRLISHGKPKNVRRIDDEK